MAYSELIKNFTNIRSCLRDFYVYGFKYPADYTGKSTRTHEYERQRVRAWLGSYMYFKQDREGRRVFLSVDSRSVPANPLYMAFRIKTFTDWDITLHFHLLDILDVSDGISIKKISEELADRMPDSGFNVLPDERTVRDKLTEYAKLGLVVIEKQGKKTFYRRSADTACLPAWDAAAAFFSEASPLGVVGSFIQDRLPVKFGKFRFKHHYILNALDEDVLYTLFDAIGKRRLTAFTFFDGRKTSALPLKIYIGTQTGRQYVLALLPENGHFSFIRTDLVKHVKLGECEEYPADLPARLEDFCSHTWGVAGDNGARLEHLEMTVSVDPGEEHIVERLEREKRCGLVERIDGTHWRFTADVYDALELLPWLRTFTGRVTDLQCTDGRVTARFREDLDELLKIYAEGGEGNVVS